MSALNVIWAAMFAGSMASALGGIAAALLDEFRISRLAISLARWLYGGVVADDFLRHDWFGAGFGVACLACWAWSGGEGGRRRRRAVKALGHKARALRARLVRTLRERTAPRPVLRPSPVPR